MAWPDSSALSLIALFPEGRRYPYAYRFSDSLLLATDLAAVMVTAGRRPT